jgi:hypothetical protein
VRVDVLCHRGFSQVYGAAPLLRDARTLAT